MLAPYEVLNVVVVVVVVVIIIIIIVVVLLLLSLLLLLYARPLMYLFWFHVRFITGLNK